MLTINTGDALKAKEFDLDGQRFQLAPLGAGTYTKLIALAPRAQKAQDGKLSGSELAKIQEQQLELLRPSIEPADKWLEWEQMARGRSELVFWQVVSALMELQLEGARISK